MIKIAGSAAFNFTVPVDRSAAFAYYSDMQRLARHLKHINLVQARSGEHFRMAYETVELGAYTIHVLCDVHMTVSPTEYVIQINAIDNLPAIQPQATANGTSGRGYYTSIARFMAEDSAQGALTRIDYQLKLKANLPPPLSLRLMPRRIRNKIAQGITTKRLREIAEHFITDSAQTLATWMDKPAVYAD